MPSPRPALRRATHPEAKSERRAAILHAAEALLHRTPLGSFSVAELARRAGLAKGTLYLYFRTREEVLLAVHAERQQRMFDALEAALAAKRVGVRQLTRATMRYLREHPEFLPLAASCRGMLETNIGSEAALAFKLAIGARLAQLGPRIETLFPALGRGQGVTLLMASYALMIGLWQLAEPPECLRVAMRRPEMRVHRIDFEKVLTAALTDLWQGATAGKPKTRRS